MRLHHYPGLFGDARSRGLRWAVGISVAVHGLLFAVAGQLKTRPVERTFFAPVHIVDLVERSPGPAAKPADGPQTPAAPAPAVAAPAPKPPAPVPEAPAPAPAKPAAPTPPPPKAEPRVTKEAVERLLTKPAPAAKPAPSQEPSSEARIAERIARMREQQAAAAPPSAPAGSPSSAEDGGRVRDAIDSIRQRVGPAAAGQTAGGAAPQVGVRGGGTNTLQQVRQRAYYNQLWDHVTRYWMIPPSLQGQRYSVIVSVILDRQGNLVRSWVEEPSVSAAFDRSALQALERAQPFPAIPEAVSGDTLEVGFRFSPE